ncbi:MAG: FkbM family methyltransferase (plasmid) [Candidatus Algichlamydia australiensis]|nr:FkbM family methyltransferase [Chlamydiales bacterium]
MKYFGKIKIGNLIEYLKIHRISVSSSLRVEGIKDTLFAWFLNAVSIVYFQSSSESIPYSVNFATQFFFATVVILLISFFRSIFKFGNLSEVLKFLKINQKSEFINEKGHLPPESRKKLIVTRALFATVGYIAYSLARVLIGEVDNSSIYSADALVYAVMATWILKEKYSKQEWLGIVVASMGVLSVIFYDFIFNNWSLALSGSVFGVFSSLSFVIIFFLTSIIIQHDPPLRISFYQCLIGFFVSLPLLLYSLVFGDFSGISNLWATGLFQAVINGALYGISLIFFFRAFLFTEPIIIAVLGLSLFPFVSFLSWFSQNQIPSSLDFLSAGLITIGGVILIRGEYKRDKQSQNLYSAPSYRGNIKDHFKQLKIEYNEGKIDKWDYMSERHEFNKLLFEFSEELIKTDINEITIDRKGVFFRFDPLNIVLQSDGGCGTPPLTVLNFGEYEREESYWIYELVTDGDVILDLGANVGWYSINLSKRFPNSKILAFEPIDETYDYLLKNISLNKIANVKTFNFGLSDQEKIESFFYFRGGSAISSIKNLIDHAGSRKKNCIVKKLDDVIQNEELDEVSFVKMDIEGAELLALKGSLSTINKYYPIIFAELYQVWCRKFLYDANDVLKILKSYGYQCFNIVEKKLVKTNKIPFENENYYNYIFLHEKNHLDKIKKYIGES